MKLISVITPLVALFSVASAISVSHDAAYDNGQALLSTVQCSNGATAFSKYVTFGKMPSYPYIGSAKDLACGSCYQLKYNQNPIYVTVISQTTEDGFHISQNAMDELMNGSGNQVARDSSSASGVIDAQYTLIDDKYCGL